MKTFLISLPSDEDGFVGRACDAPACQQYFKILVPHHKERLYCPYCGQSFPGSSLLTREQTNHVQEVAAEEVRAYMLTQVQNAFKKAVRGSKFLTFESGPGPTKRTVIPNYTEREVDTELKCAECNTRFQVYGIFGYCPGCSCENLRLYDANWTIIKRGLTNAADENRQLRYAYGDLVSTFEVFCQRKARRITSETGNFQVLFDARKFFKQHANVDILANLSADKLLTMRRVFQKRHVCVHSGGEITERYVKMIPEDSVLLGQQVSLSVQELEEGANAMRVALGELTRSLEQPGK